MDCRKSLLSYEATYVGHCWTPPCTAPRQAISLNVCTTIWVPLQLSHFSRTVEIPLCHITTVEQKVDNKLYATDKDKVKIRALISKSSLNQWTWNWLTKSSKHRSWIEFRQLSYDTKWSLISLEYMHQYLFYHSS